MKTFRWIKYLEAGKTILMTTYTTACSQRGYSLFSERGLFSTVLLVFVKNLCQCVYAVHSSLFWCSWDMERVCVFYSFRISFFCLCQSFVVTHIIFSSLFCKAIDIHNELGFFLLLLLCMCEHVCVCNGCTVHDF